MTAGKYFPGPSPTVRTKPQNCHYSTFRDRWPLRWRGATYRTWAVAVATGDGRIRAPSGVTYVARRTSGACCGIPRFTIAAPLLHESAAEIVAFRSKIPRGGLHGCGERAHYRSGGPG